MAELPHMTDEEKYLFDLQGFILVKGVLGAETLKQLHASMEEHGIQKPDNHPNKSRFSNFLSWGEEWCQLVDHPRILPFLNDLIGAKFRLDHAYGMAARSGGEEGGFGLHHHAGMFNHACYYMTHGQTMHNGLMVVSYALVDMPAGGGGFCCVPGSHKALFPTPKQYYSTENNPLLVQVPMQAGDVVIFSEALTHGTMKWTNAHERRSVLLKYCPHYMQWTTGPMKSDFPGLTERQKLILQAPYVWNRPAIDP
jgi:hypothetical protein